MDNNNKKDDPVQIHCTLCILGAGYGGIGALVAASENLIRNNNSESSPSVVVIDRRRGWGGNWIEQYEFLRLHQPYRHFTAGRHAWKSLKNKPRDYLATKKEVLCHFQDIANQVSKKIHLECLFGHECDGYDEEKAIDDSDDGEGGACSNVLVKAHSIDYDERPVIVIRADKFIRATGFDIPIKRPLSFSSSSSNKASSSIVSVAVGDPMLCDSEIIHAGNTKSVYILGSGKTAMDLVCMLAANHKKHSELSRRSGDSSNNNSIKIVLIAGRGCCFGVRERMFVSKGWRRWLGGGALVTDIMYDFCKDWDGQNNHAECLAQLQKRGLVDSPIPDANIWYYGLLGANEIQTVKETVSKVIKGHVDDIVDDADGNPVIHMRSGEKIPIEKGSIVVNCTGHLVAPPEEKLLSPHGHVLSPQTALLFPGPTNYFLATVFLRGDLPKVADQLYRSRFGGAEPKDTHAVHSTLAFLANLLILFPYVPLSVLLHDASNFNTWYPLHRQGLSFARLLSRRKKILRQAEELKLERFGG